MDVNADMLIAIGSLWHGEWNLTKDVLVSFRRDGAGISTCSHDFGQVEALPWQTRYLLHPHGEGIVAAGITYLTHFPLYVVGKSLVSGDNEPSLLLTLSSCP